MILHMDREASKNGATLSRLYADGVFVCDVLEDEVREVTGQPVAAWKKWGVTAIPAGTYPIRFETSNRFGPQTLTVKDVEGFEGIRIHGGNTSANTEGCLLPGTRNSNCTVASSQAALSKLKDIVLGAFYNGEDVTLTIHNPLEEA